MSAAADRAGNLLPRVSFVIPTLNSASVLGLCLESIRAQDYPREQVEIVVADAGSTDSTRDLAARYGVDRIVENPLRTGEAGKAAGFAAATGEIIALVDSDNILPGPDWLRRMVAPFEDPLVVGSEPLWYEHRPGDPLVTRYCALTGVNDPLVSFLGNYDRLNYLTGRWTGLEVPTEERDGWLRVHLQPQALPTMGANGFLVRAEALRNTQWSPYLADIDTVWDLVSQGRDIFAKVRVGIVHLYCPDIRTFARKQTRRIRDYTYYSGQGMRRYPWKRRLGPHLVRFVLYCVSVVPLLWQTARGWLRKPDRAWLFHPLACWITLWVYSSGVVRARFVRREMDRSTWKQ